MQEVPNMGYMEILDLSFIELSQANCITRNPNVKLAKDFVELWQIDTEVVKGSFLLEVCFYVGFDEFFPLSIPRIYVSKGSHEAIGLIPHIDKNGFVCTHHDDSLILDQNNPAGIIKECLCKAKGIIEKGLLGNNDVEFKKEFGAYWTDVDDKDYNSLGYLSLINEYPVTTSLITILVLKSPYNHIKYVLYNDENEPATKRFLEFLSMKRCSGRRYKALFVCGLGDAVNHPFPTNNNDVLNILDACQLSEFKKYVNSNNNVEKHVFFLATTTESSILVGWKHKLLCTKKNGHRDGIISQYDALSKYQKNDKITRILVNSYSNKRVENRTSGITNEKYCFLITGLGSIGSNLLFFLNAMNYPDYKIVDNDALKIENIGRHLLGMGSVNTLKVDAVYKYIKNIRPDQNIIIKHSPIEPLLKNNLDFFNDCSYAFIAIGNQNVENHIIKLISNGNITTPVFFLWVEPYAIGGHCLYIHPDDIVDINTIYENNLYCRNVIDNSEYMGSNPILSKQEAGCQTAYTPYSCNDVILFLSSIYKWMNNIIKNNTKVSGGVQWIGNVNLANDLGITIHNKEITVSDSYSHIVFDLNNDNTKK